ncbi:type 1 glutamine amidotransferase [Actinopolymorpha pittospori]|uniref:GMP synthase-like glutamine amidotransferase n=1 Tax=Actinopolymorpha pittospori TaxID=648752 RepID=A0A927N1N2_9ACTN|nr:type 1 glutamine amidotransferase [Actinopolymorpha pittospori]MBE1610986.1 GMP synthase-like glutamine amidotransferase [Actinopolymorpha pittospori]
MTAFERDRLLVVQHEDDCPLGWFGPWLAEGGIAVDVVRPYAGDPLPGLDGHAGLLVLGGSMGAYDDATCPWLGPVKALLREAVARRLPTLGICLGHQLLAVACGGRVDRNPDGRTIGLVKLSLADAAHGDPMFGQVADGAAAVRWNQDIVVDLPPKASLLATDDRGTPYAVCVGERAWGVQFHPEAGPGPHLAFVRAGLRRPGPRRRGDLGLITASRQTGVPSRAGRSATGRPASRGDEREELARQTAPKRPGRRAPTVVDATAPVGEDLAGATRRLA